MLIFFLNFRDSINGPRTDHSVSMQLAQLIQDMFIPHDWQKGETLGSRSRAAITRDSWMDYLGCEVQRVFNPVMPHESGPDTTSIRKNLATAIRTTFFGLAMDVRFQGRDRCGSSTFTEIDLPLPKSKRPFV